MSWLQARLHLTADRVERAERLLEALGAASVTVTDAGDQPVLEPLPGRAPLWPECRVEALFGSETDIEALQWALAEAALPPATLTRLADGEWTERWRQHAVRYLFADRLWLVPRDEPAPAGCVLRMDPGLAFGSGSHPTTRLCLSWLAGQDLSGRTVLDYGCGSGILGLAARVLGCERVLAIDHDPQALLATRQNAEYNGLLDERFAVGTPEAANGQTFDLVVANILANPLVELAPTLKRALRPDGVLVMSGMLESQAATVAGAYPELSFEAVRVEADEQDARWACLVGHTVVGEREEP